MRLGTRESIFSVFFCVGFVRRNLQRAGRCAGRGRNCGRAKLPCGRARGAWGKVAEESDDQYCLPWAQCSGGVCEDAGRCRTFDAYPQQFHEMLAKADPFAVTNVIVTAIGGGEFRKLGRGPIRARCFGAASGCRHARLWAERSRDRSRSGAQCMVIDDRAGGCGACEGHFAHADAGYEREVG